jgi:hypothetical protein
MGDFLRFFNEVASPYDLLLQINCNNINEWEIQVFKKIYEQGKDNKEICHVRERDRELCFAKAQVLLKQWLIENENGYDRRINEHITHYHF